MTQRASTGFMHGTEMCNVKEGKKLNDWSRLQTTKAFLEALSSNMGIPTIGLIESKAGGTDVGGAGRCGQFCMRGEQEEGARVQAGRGGPFYKQFTNTYDDCAL